MPGLSVEELASLEGQERSNIEARIQWLRDIQTLLDGAMVLMHQYNQVATNSGSVYTHFNICTKLVKITNDSATVSFSNSIKYFLLIILIYFVDGIMINPYK